MEQQLDPVQRYDWEQELLAVHRTRVLVEVLPAREARKRDTSGVRPNPSTNRSPSASALRRMLFP
jgi:hypothetical protein